MADKQTVKVGDRITAKSDDSFKDYRAGNSFYVQEVDEQDGETIVVFTDNVGDKRYRRVREFTVEHAPVADATGKPAFKVGDRVKIGGDHPYILSDSNTTGKIIGGNNGRRGEWEVQLDNYGGSLSFKTDELKRLPSPLTIETGKFYRTRDGRKVGPMERVSHNGQFRDTSEAVTGYGWYSNGTYIEGVQGNIDLIAEWIDEPAGNDNAPSSKSAIVALIEGGHPKPSDAPKVHKSEQSATDEAERLAVKYPGQKFGVFVLADSRIAEIVMRRAA